MKQKFMKKALAVVLSTAMTFSLSSMQIQTASAAKKFVSLNTTFKTLKVGQKYSLKLKNNTISWKVKKAVSTDKAVANVYAKSASNVKIKGKSTGRATIRVNVETAARKTNNKKTLRCRIKVVHRLRPLIQHRLRPHQILQKQARRCLHRRSWMRHLAISQLQALRSARQVQHPSTSRQASIAM